MTSVGPELLKAVCERGLEGVVAKRIDAPYRSGYFDTWIKAKCTEKERFAVIGFDPQGRKRVAALELARLVGSGDFGHGVRRDAQGARRGRAPAGGVADEDAAS